MANSPLRESIHSPNSIWSEPAEPASWSVPLHHGDPGAEYRAARDAVALRDASHWGRLLIRGGDHLDFLHRMTTNDFNHLEAGQGCEAVFIEQRGRVIDLGIFYRGTDSTLLLVSPSSRQAVPAWLDRFIFSETIEFEDITATTAMVECCGPQAADIARRALDCDIAAGAPGDLLRPSAADGLWLARADWDGHPGLRAVGPPGALAELWQKLAAAGARPLGEEAWDILRVERGEPRLGRELTDAYNPWEAGLGRAIHMDKGCYIGQEVIARLDTYDKVKQHLVGLRLPPGPLPAPGQALGDGQREVGLITSVAASPLLGPIALGYVRRHATGEGTELFLEDRQATVVPLPFPLP